MELLDVDQESLNAIESGEKELNKSEMKIIADKIGQNILINIGISDQYINNKQEQGTITINNNPNNRVIIPLLINDNHLFL